METNYAWAAGFLDGEGGFYIYKESSRGYGYIRGFLKANQAVYDAPIRRLYELFGGSTRERGQRTSTGKTVYEWQLAKASDIKQTLPLLIPYMVVKRPQAELLLELVKYAHNGGRGGNPFTEEREEIYQRFQAYRIN